VSSFERTRLSGGRSFGQGNAGASGNFAVFILNKVVLNNVVDEGKSMG